LYSELTFHDEMEIVRVEESSPPYMSYDSHEIEYVISDNYQDIKRIAKGNTISYGFNA